MLDIKIQAVHIIPTASHRRSNFFGDKFVIRRSIHSTTAFAATPTALNMRPGFAWNGSVCASLEQPNYQPKQRDLDRTEQLN